MSLYLGCPAWGIKGWIGGFLPATTRQKDLLSAYSRRLNTVEGNTTFYALPTAEQVERWRDATPETFRFCLKFPQVISHRKRLVDCRAETAEFVDRLRVLGARCGPAFLQLPPTFSLAHLKRLETYLAELPSDLRFAVEPRHADFFDGGRGEQAFDDTLKRHGMARVAFDTAALFAVPAGHSADVVAAQERKPRFPARATRTADFAFVRFVGQPTVADNEAWLTPWADHVAGWSVADDVFFFTHLPDDTDAPELARLFHGLVGARRALPPLGEGDAPAVSQPTLF